METTNRSKKMSAFKLKLIKGIDSDGKNTVCGYVHIKTTESMDGNPDKEYVNIVLIDAKEALDILDFRHKISFKEQTMRIIPRDVVGLETILLRIVHEAYKESVISMDEYVEYIQARLQQYALRYSSDRRLAAEFYTRYISKMGNVVYPTFGQLMKDNIDEVNNGLVPRVVELKSNKKAEVYNIEEQLLKAMTLAIENKLKCQTSGAAESTTEGAESVAETESVTEGVTETESVVAPEDTNTADINTEDTAAEATE